MQAKPLITRLFCLALLPLSSSLEANPVPLDFSGGNGTSQPDQWQGQASGGWDQWGISKNAAGTLTAATATANPLFDGGHTYLSTSTSITNTRGTVRRTYFPTASFSTAQPHSIVFSHRLDSNTAGFDAGGRRALFFGSNVTSETTSGNNSWFVEINAAGNWTVSNGNKAGGTTTIDTGLAAVLGTTYPIAIHVDPTSKEYSTTIADSAQLIIQTTSTNVRVGDSGTGTVTQTGGTFLAPANGASYIGHFQGSSGTWTISGGTLDQGSLSIGGGGTAGSGGIGLLDQSGGTVFARRDLRLGRGTSTATYDLSAGALTVTNQNGDGRPIVGHDNTGTGIFNHYGTGIVSLHGGLTLAATANTTGTYNLAGGELRTNLINSGSGSSAFNFSSGTLRPLNNNASINTPLTLTGSGGIILTDDASDTPRTITVNSPIGQSGGSHGFTVDGDGRLVLNPASTYSGGTTILSGTVVAANNSSLGTGTITFAGDSAIEALNANRTLANPIHINDGITATALTNAGEILRFNGNLTGSGTIQTGDTPGQWTVQFGGNNSAFTGTIRSRENGTIRLQTATSAPTNGTLELVGNGIVNLNQNAANLTYHVGTLTGEATSIVRGFDHNVARTLSVGQGNHAGLIQNGAGTVALEKTAPAS